MKWFERRPLNEDAFDNFCELGDGRLVEHVVVVSIHIETVNLAIHVLVPPQRGAATQEPDPRIGCANNHDVSCERLWLIGFLGAIIGS